MIGNNLLRLVFCGWTLAGVVISCTVAGTLMWSKQQQDLLQLQDLVAQMAQHQRQMQVELQTLERTVAGHEALLRRMPN